MKKKVLIGLSWPYANGRLHIGHVASSLPADALARFHRSIGNDVSFVTGSDCYGTPILVRATAEGITPTELANKYHAYHDADFKALGFTFDNYDKTISERHHKFVKKFHEELYKSEYIYEKTAPQLYCDKCNKFLPDRYVEGVCPFCKKDAKGDSCESCGKILEPEDLKNPKCLLCKGTPVVKDQTQLYLKLSALQGQIQKFFDERKNTWTQNAQGLTQRYLNEGLRDRAITRSMDWGIPIPKAGWDDRRIYIWAENVLGYLSASTDEFIQSGRSKGVQGSPLVHYYVHAKDNIPFHSIILPALIMANSKTKYHLPDIIVSSEYVTVNGQKLSKSKGNNIDAHTLFEKFDADMVRYYFLRTVNDKRDSNFTLEDFVNIVNGELVNNFGNLVNRTLSFAKTRLADAKVFLVETKEIKDHLRKAKEEFSNLMHAGQVNKALARAMELVNFGNKHFDDCKPWISIKSNVNKCAQDISEVIAIIIVAGNLLKPFIPTACEKLERWLSGDTIGDIEILFKRLDLKEITI